MKLLNKIFYIIGTICIIIALYILFDKYVIKDNVTFDGNKEINLVNDRLTELGSSLGFVVIVNGIDNQDNGKYKVTYEEDLLSNYGYRQLFVMEYILSNNSNYDMFTTISRFDYNEIDGSPNDEFNLAYIKYDEYNNYYKSLFGEDFVMSKAIKGNTSYDNNHVYYENRRAGSNGVYVSMMQTDSVKYNDGIYTANVSITYSTRASELIGKDSDTGIIDYTKDINDNIIFKSFTLKDS